MVSVFCVGVGEFLTFAAMVLAILVNMGQITQNIVARSIYYAELDTTAFEATLRTAANAGGTSVQSVYASDQSAPAETGAGIKFNYKWGLYNYCGGEASGTDRDCFDRNFGFQFQPVTVLQNDATSEIRPFIQNAIGDNAFTDGNYLGRFTQPASYLAFIGTVLIGLSFLIAFLAHRFAFLLASLLALLAAACFIVAAAIWTALINRSRSGLSDANIGLQLNYGNAVWMEWAAAAAAALSVVPLLIACISGRKSKY